MFTNANVLGRTPDLKGKSVFKEFIYTFRIENNVLVGPLFRSDAQSWLKKEYESLQYSSKIEKEKEWWVYALLVLGKSFSVFNKLHGASIVKRILCEVEILSVEELERKVNVLALSHNEVYPVFLAPRIIVMEDVGSNYVKNRTLKSMVNKIDVLYTYLKKNFSESYINVEYLEGLESKVDSLHWYAELLLTDVGYSLASSSSEEEIEQVFKEYENHLPVLIKTHTDIQQFDSTLFVQVVMKIIKGEEVD